MRAELRLAQWVWRAPENGTAALGDDITKHSVVLLTPRVVGINDPVLLPKVLKGPAPDHSASDGGVERLVKSDGARVRLSADLVGLTDRDEELASLLGLLIDSHLNVSGQTADDELDTLAFNQLLRALGAGGWLELIVAEEHLDLAPHHAPARIELVYCQFGATLLVSGNRGKRASEGKRKADFDRCRALGAHVTQEVGAGEQGHRSGTRGGQEAAAS